ncbi:MAG: hypothetical protein NT154_15070 [Verrucomicrobia bacterium]|nr:hypothetical protein [Verrucomicrobiota bacterium]
MGKKNGAVCRDCAEPHENPNLTVINKTDTAEICSKKNQMAGEGWKMHCFAIPYRILKHHQNAGVLMGKRLFADDTPHRGTKCALIKMTSAARRVIVIFKIHDDEWQSATGNGD